MQNSGKPSVRRIAEEAGVSVATVSRALRGLPVVSPAARLKVERCARELGYQYSPLVGSVLSNLRRSTHASFAGNLAVVALRKNEGAGLLPFQRRQVEGAMQKAKELGFRIDLQYFTIGVTTLKSLRRILRSRGIKGIIFLSSDEKLDMTEFNWEGFSAVQNDLPLTAPHLSTVGIDHHRTVGVALAIAKTRGYREIGFFLERPKDVRLAYKWSGAFLGYQAGDPAIGRVPLLEVESLSPDVFLSWFRRYQPDLLVGHKTDVIGWLSAEGVRVPEDVGYFTLNVAEAKVPCAGLDLVPEAQGATAVRAVVGQVVRFEDAIRSRPEAILLEGEWVEGATFRTSVRTDRPARAKTAPPR